MNEVLSLQLLIAAKLVALEIEMIDAKAAGDVARWYNAQIEHDRFTTAWEINNSVGLLS